MASWGHHLVSSWGLRAEQTVLRVRLLSLGQGIHGLRVAQGSGGEKVQEVWSGRIPPPPLRGMVLLPCQEPICDWG